jgi:hypothetical protein
MKYEDPFSACDFCGRGASHRGRAAPCGETFQNGADLQEIQPADLGAYKDLLLQLRWMGRCRHDEDVRALSKVDATLAIEPDRPVRAKRNFPII